MSLIKSIRAQLGLSNTPANNFTLDASADNGTIHNDFYVYAHCKENGEPYYIGKGRRWRYCDLANRSGLWNRYAKKYGVKHHFVAKNLTEVEAYNFERLIVASLGKRCDNSGVLANITDGGIGVIGLRHTEETKKKLSIAHSGKKLTAEHREKMSESHKISQNNPDIKAKLVAIRNTDDFKKQASEKAAANWKDPEHKSRMAEIKRKQWADPEYRAKMLLARKQAAERRAA